MPEEKDEKLEYLKRGEVKTMQKDVAELREKEAKQEREKISQIKTEEEMQREKERKERAQGAAMEREMAGKEAKIKEEELKRLREEREKKAEVMEKEETKKEETRAEGFKELLKETQIKEEEERRKFLARVEAKVGSKEELPAPPPEPKRDMPKLSFKKPSFSQKLWIRIVLALLLLAILAAIATFWYWYLVVREKEAPPPVRTEEEIVPETPKIVEPSINERILEWGYDFPLIPRTIDTIIIHSVYNALGGDVHDIEMVIQEYKYYGVAAHYLITRDGIIYRLAPDEAIAYHAGASQMPDGRENVNDFSIGIEIINTKDESPTEYQYQALSQLVRYLQDKYNIVSENVLGHKDVAPNRKTDPWNFDWEKFNQLIKS